MVALLLHWMYAFKIYNSEFFLLIGLLKNSFLIFQTLHYCSYRSQYDKQIQDIGEIKTKARVVKLLLILFYKSSTERYTVAYDYSEQRSGYSLSNVINQHIQTHSVKCRHSPKQTAQCWFVIACDNSLLNLNLTWGVSVNFFAVQAWMQFDRVVNFHLVAQRCLVRSPIWCIDFKEKM